MSTRYVPPTEEEIRSVDEYWAQVHAAIFGGGPAPTTPLDEELLYRVNEHRWREKCLSCPHHEIVFVNGDPPKCGDCEQPVRVLSELQIEVMKENA